MAQLKISELPDGGPLQVGDAMVLVRGGETFRSVFSGHLVSYTWNNNGNTAVGNNLSIGQLDGMLLAYDADLIAMSIIRTDNDLGNIEVLNNGVVIKTVASTEFKVVETFSGISCSALDVISVRNGAGGNTVSNCGVTLTFRIG